MRRPSRHRDQGFSLPEVMVSSILVALVVTNSTNLYMRSQGSLRSTSLRDAVNARIAADLEDLRNRSWRFGCEDGTQGSSISTACTGNSQDADRPVRYKSGRAAGAGPTPLQEYQDACDAAPNINGMAALMQTKDPRFQNGTTTLQLASNGENRALASSNVSIQRTIRLDNADRNKLHITYATTDGAPVRVRLNSTIVPQALGWCP